MKRDEERVRNRWVVGLDLQPDSVGPLRFAQWIRSQLGNSGGPRMIGVHVLEGFYLYSMMRHHDVDKLVRLAAEAVEDDVEKAGAEEAFDAIHVLPGSGADHALEEFCNHRGASALVVGRHAERSDRAEHRLGRVTRRAIRGLSRPTIVVPPAFEADAAGEGPIVVATDLDDVGVNAARFARRLADSIGRELRLLHVVPTPERYGARYAPRESLEELRQANEAGGRDALERWCEEHVLADELRSVRAGSVVGSILRVAREWDAAMLVLGSRHLSLLERVVISSVGTEVAATAPCPVALVPTGVAGKGR